MSAIPEQSHPDLDRSRRLPLLSDDGRNFLAGRIDARSYLARSRDRAEQQAREDIARRHRNLWSRAQRWAGYATLAFSTGFLILSRSLRESAHPLLALVSAGTWAAVTLTVTAALMLTRPPGSPDRPDLDGAVRSRSRTRVPVRVRKRGAGEGEHDGEDAEHAAHHDSLGHQPGRSG